ncbi:unnamed protein product [Adineta ricciae]|uniref:Uncharacterized protein n=1 Tax=Adineta ricciae TaxID=249248 RepID=A0A813VKV6_ADIRI|nr:unnamed protein product [Adineta ricciae]CAF1574550.1 unnamed protein product [Adineta ricciae]
MNTISSTSILVDQSIENANQSRIEKLVQLLLSFNVDRKRIDESNHQHAKLVLRIFAIYMIFVSNVLIVAVLMQSAESFLITNTFECHLIQKRFAVKTLLTERNVQHNVYMINFNQIATIQDIWQFMNETLAEVFLRVQQQPSRPNSTLIHWVLDHFLLIGVVRMRQVRVKPEKCHIPKLYSDEIADCYPAYSSDKKDTDPFGPITLSDSTDINLKQPWRFMSKDKTGMGSHTGQHGKYDGSGYIADLAQYDRTYRRFTRDINELERFHWLDKATRALFIDIITYNPSVNLFSYIKLVFEMPLTGGIFPSHKVENFQLFRYVGSKKYVLIICEATIVLFTIIFLLVEILTMIKLKFKIFLSFWNWIDMILLIISILLIIVNIYRLILINSTLTNQLSIYLVTFDTAIVKLLRLHNLFDTLSILLASISIIRILKYCDFAVMLIRIKATIQRCLGDLIGFLVMFVAIMIAYAQFGNLVLGQQAPAFSTVGKAFVALFRTVLGDFNFEDIRDAAPIVGPLFFFFYIFSMVFMLFNMVLAIIVDSYEELGSERRDIINQMLVDVTPFMKHSIQRFFERLGVWTKVRVLVHSIIRAEDISNTKTIGDLLQEFKYSATSSTLYEELHQAFVHDMTKTISKKDFDAFLKYAHRDKDRQRDTLQSLFTGKKSLINFNEEQDWNTHASNLCTIQQWAQLRYRIARLEELFNSMDGKWKYSMRTSKNLLRTRNLSREISEEKQNT